MKAWQSSVIMKGIQEKFIMFCSLGNPASFLFAPKVSFVIYNALDIPLSLLGMENIIITIDNAANLSEDAYDASVKMNSEMSKSSLRMVNGSAPSDVLLQEATEITGENQLSSNTTNEYLAKIHIPLLEYPIFLKSKEINDLDTYVPLELSWDLSTLNLSMKYLLFNRHVLYVNIEGILHVLLEPNYLSSVPFCETKVPVYFDPWRPSPPYMILYKEH